MPGETPVAMVVCRDIALKLSSLTKIGVRQFLVQSLIKSYDLTSRLKLVPASKATVDDLLTYHSRDYVRLLSTETDAATEEELEEHGLGYDCPSQDQLLDWCLTVAGGSVTAARLLVSGQARIVINWAGGWHHAHRDMAAGFCYVNDIVIAIHKLQSKFKRILYVDLDIHHGDGVEEAFSSTDKVLTFSIHKLEPGFFPGSGAVTDVGSGRGRYHSINVPLAEGVTDSMYSSVFSSLLPAVMARYTPDCLVLQCGADCLVGDPLGGFNLTPAALGGCVKELMSYRIPMMVVGGGGYNRENTARCWTAITATILGTELEDDIPDEDRFFTNYGPDFTVGISAGCVKNKNKQEDIDLMINQTGHRHTMKTVLMVAEKPSLAQSISNILSKKNCEYRKGFNGACAVNEWQGKFPPTSETVRFRMTSVCGHVMSIDFPGKYNNWDKVDPVELFRCPTEKKEATTKLRMPAFLNSEAKGCDYIVLWLDCDKEGENICFEVLDSVSGAMKRLDKKTVFRAKFSSITDKDIVAAMNNLGEPDENQSKSVDARQELDLRIGCAFTRFQTRFFQGKYGDLDSSLISYGPCQTPTLGFCVDRHDAITNHKPEPYWVVQLVLEAGEQKRLNVEWERVRSFDKEVAVMFLQMVKSQSEAVVTSVSKKDKQKERPIALNTVELMRVASSGLNMGPHHAMMIAEKLYTQGYISYPRTESTQYAESFDLKDIVRQLQHNPDYADDCKAMLSAGLSKPRKGHDAGDHPPITPCRGVSRGELDGDAWKLYDYIARHYLATVAANCKYEQTSVNIECGGEKFSLTGKKVTDPGFTALMIWQAIPDEESIPDIKQGTKLSVKEVKLAERQTSPPGYLTEADLITLMEKHGVGTDASIPVHINNICTRNYVTIESGRRLVPTNLGIVLVHGYLKIDPDLVKPTMRSAVEKQLDLIAHGKADFDSVLSHTLEVFKLKFLYFVTNITGMDQLFEVSFSTLADSGRPFSRCGKCRRFMKLVEAKPKRLFCSTCDETYSVPQQNGNLKLHQELKCPLDDFELIYFTAGPKGKSFVFCPYCYSNPPFPGIKAGSSCSSCTHPTCLHGLNNLGVSGCMDCEAGGILVLDPASIPKWKLVCNKCDVIVSIFNDAAKVSVLSEELCEECETVLMKVEYKEGKSKLPNERLSKQGCIYCDPDLNHLIQKSQAVLMKNRRGGGRGRGGRGRGRGGRGRKAPKDKMSQLANYFV